MRLGTGGGGRWYRAGWGVQVGREMGCGPWGIGEYDPPGGAAQSGGFKPTVVPEQRASCSTVTCPVSENHMVGHVVPLHHAVWSNIPPVPEHHMVGHVVALHRPV